jgi:polysaccharide export outer membrane protein
MRFSALLAACGILVGGVTANASALAQSSSVTVTAQSTPLRAYRINPGDEIEVYVWGEERLQRTVKVLPDGTFSFPLVGQIDALNKLPQDIEAEVALGLKSQYRETVPKVTVSVRSATGLQFSVAGKVRTPGAFTPGRYVNVLEALALAGGPAEFANLSEVTILRKVGGRLTAIKVRLTDVLKGNPNARDLAGIPELESGDTVIVP